MYAFLSALCTFTLYPWCITLFYETPLPLFAPPLGAHISMCRREEEEEEEEEDGGVLARILV